MDAGRAVIFPSSAVTLPLPLVLMSVPRSVSRQVQFGWVAQPSLVNGVAARTLAVPSLVVINASDYTHYVPDDEPAHITEQAVTQFLDDILAGRVQVRQPGVSHRGSVAAAVADTAGRRGSWGELQGRRVWVSPGGRFSRSLVSGVWRDGLACRPVMLDGISGYCVVIRRPLGVNRAVLYDVDTRHTIIPGGWWMETGIC